MPKLTLPDGTVLDLPYDHPTKGVTPNASEMSMAQTVAGGGTARANARASAGAKPTQPSGGGEVGIPVVRPPGYANQRTVAPPAGLPMGQVGQIRQAVGGPDGLNMFNKFTETAEGQGIIRGLIDQMIMQRRVGNPGSMANPPSTRSADLVAMIMNYLRGNGRTR